MKKLILLLCCLSINLYATAQLGQWTWLKGQTPSFGTKGVPSPTNQPLGLYQAASFTDLQGKFWLFGGSYRNNSGPSVTYADLWKYDPLTNNWTWMKGTGTQIDAGNYGTIAVPDTANRPCNRGWGMASWTDLNGDFWIFGGKGWTGAMHDVWKYNIASNTWTWMHGDPPLIFNVKNPVYGTQGVSHPANTPGSRDEMGSTWVDSNNNLWMFGGIINFFSYNDMWMFNTTTNEWTWMKGDTITLSPGNYGTLGVEHPNNLPSARSSYTNWTDNSGNFWLFGGGDVLGNGEFNDMWRFNPSTNNWTWMGGNGLENYGAPCVSSVNRLPANRYENSACWTDDAGNFWMYGGGSGASSLFENYNDLWRYSPNTLQWTFIHGSNAAYSAQVTGTLGIPSAFNTPGSRTGAISWRGNNGKLYLFGGNINVNYTTTSSDKNIFMYQIDWNCPSVTSIEEMETDLGIHLAPNPASGEVTLSWTSSAMNHMQFLSGEKIRITDLLGKEVFVQQINSTVKSVTLNISTFSNGIYQAHVLTSEKVYCKKFVVAN